MIFDSTRPMKPNERMAYDLGRAESNAELAALRAQVDSLTRERDDARRIANDLEIDLFDELTVPCKRCRFSPDNGGDCDEDAENH